MNYHHSYHAGNFADVLKHLVLIMLLERLQEKVAPFSFLDTHAGAGAYFLNSSESQKKREYEQGIAQLFFNSRGNIPDTAKKYLGIINTYNTPEDLNYYPGSPLIASHFIRDQDRMILCELHPDEKYLLKQNISNKEKRIEIHHQNGYLGMKAFLPPKENRGLVLIDPPFEITNEFSQIIDSLQLAIKHWRAGQYVIWYPIKNSTAVTQFEGQLKKIKSDAHELLIIHLTLNNPQELGKLSSCGLAILNSPWKLKETLDEGVLPYLKERLNAEIYSTLIK